MFDYDKVHYDGVLFCNEHILTLINDVKKSQSILPVLHMWAEIKRYKYLHDADMIKEFTQFVFIVTRYSLKHQFPKVFEDDTAVKNIYFMKAIENLTLDQILDFLDILVEDLPVFINKYELDSSMTWKEWIDKYFFPTITNIQQEKKTVDNNNEISKLNSSINSANRVIA